MQFLHHIPQTVRNASSRLEEAGFEAYLVGGCVRDLLTGKTPKDWDMTTDARPEQIIELFEKTVYENSFGTVAVIFQQGDISRETNEPVTHVTGEDVDQIEITPYRLEAAYEDFRRPKEVAFSKNIEDDLQRRDFTVNALAYSISKGHIIDLYNGQEHIKDKKIVAVGTPADRFKEDALRLLRAVRFSTELGFDIEKETGEAIREHSGLLKNISSERVGDEFSKIILSKNARKGMLMLEEYGLLEHVLPELREGIGCEQKGEHIYDVFLHLLAALQHAADKDWPLDIRMAALLHDIGKPRTRRYDRKKDKYTFFGHEVIGARMSEKILGRLKFPRKLSAKVVSLVRNHMFFSDTEKITLSAVRRLVRSVGEENIWDLMKVRECDRVGMKKREAPYRLRKYHAMIEEALRAPLSVGMLKIDGSKIMELLGEAPGPKIGLILHALLEEALEDPATNTEDHLATRAKELAKLPLEELRARGEEGKMKKAAEEEREIESIRKRHGVR